MAVELTEDVLADVEKIFKSNRGDFSASALKINQMAYCLNTGLPDVGMEIVVRLTENLTLGQSFVSAGDASTSYYFFPIESVDIPTSKYVPLVGVSENKDYVSKVDDSTVSVLAGSGILRKADLTEHEVSWDAVPSFSVTVPEGELRWIVVKWNLGETSVEVSAEQYMPVTLDDFEQRIVIGRVWKENGVLEVSGRHILLSVDPYSSRTSWWQLPAGNRSVSVSYSTVDNGLLSLSEGELIRHPVVELSTNHHVWEFPAFASVSSAWKHIQGSTGFVRISDNASGDETDIRAIADYYDSNGSITALPNNKFVAHLVGCYAGSNERVILFGQHVYDSMQEAEIGVESDEIAEAQWYSDLGQVSKIGWVILQKGTRDFSVPTNAKFVPYSLLGSGGGSGTTPNLEQVLNVSGDVDITDSLDTDRVMSFIKNGVRQLSLFGNGSLQGQLGIFADMVMGDSRTAGTHLIDRSIECGVSGDLGGVINTVDVVESSADFVFTSSNGSFAGNGDYTDSGLTHNGKPYYVNGIYFLAYGVVTSVGGLWFIVTTLESGDLMFSNALYQQNAISETPDGVDEYTGQNAEANNGAEIIVPTGATRPSIVAETIVSKKIQAEDGSTVWSSMSEFAKQLYWQVLNTHYMELLPNEFNVHLDNAYRIRATGSYSSIESPDGTAHVRSFNGRNDITGDAVFTADVTMNAIPSGLPAGKTKAGNLAITTDGVLYYE